MKKPSTGKTKDKCSDAEHKEATMAEMDQLNSIAIGDSGPPIVHYGTHVPIAASTPTGTDIHMHTAHSSKILISRSSKVSLRVYYALLYHHLVQEQ